MAAIRRDMKNLGSGNSLQDYYLLSPRIRVLLGYDRI